MSVAWLVAVTGSYVMNSFTTFSAETGRKLRLKDYAGFVGSGIVGVIANTTTVVVAAKFMPVWAAKAIAILVSFVVNFSLSHFVVFRAEEAQRASASAERALGRSKPRLELRVERIVAREHVVDVARP